MITAARVFRGLSASIDAWARFLRIEVDAIGSGRTIKHGTGCQYRGNFMLASLPRAVLLTVILAFSLCLNTGLADTPTTNARTIEIHEGPLIGHPAGMTMMNAPCFYGDHFHYEIHSDGELRVYGPITCGKVPSGAGGEQVCYLDPRLRCQARQSFSLGAGTPYSINEHGVKAGDKTYAWANPQEAIALMPSIQTRAKEKCNEVLFWQSLDTKNNRTNSSAERVREQESCKLTLQQICASAHGRPAVLGNGKDVTVLCQR
jgi:hypothetical protein